MFAEVRDAFVVLVSFVCFLIVIVVLALVSAAMKPVRWCERPRRAG